MHSRCTLIYACTFTLHVSRVRVHATHTHAAYATRARSRCAHARCPTLPTAVFLNPLRIVCICDIDVTEEAKQEEAKKAIIAEAKRLKNAAYRDNVRDRSRCAMTCRSPCVQACTITLRHDMPLPLRACVHNHAA